MLSKHVEVNLDGIRREFASAEPFKHTCIDGFLDESLARQLLAEFPVFQPEDAVNEFGEIGRKAVKTNLKSIGPTYARLYEYMRSPAGLDKISKMLGIPDLIFDDAMYGGGTHENLEGQELDPHVDFNYDQVHGYHRRVNLLIYLNEEWSVDWGGAIQLHSNPWDWEGDSIKTFNCDFNRCVIFETNEYSWHGFERIRLPEDKKGLSRKCISIYLYTKERPADEVAPPHGTFYAQRPLPRRFNTGYALTNEDVGELRGLLKNRDGWIRLYQKHELKMGAERQRLYDYLDSFRAALRFPTIGYARQTDNSAYGLYADNWAALRAGARFIPRRPVGSLTLRLWVPPELTAGQVLWVSIDGELRGEFRLKSEKINEITIDGLSLSDREFELSLGAKESLPTGSADNRELAYIISELEFS